MILLLTQLPGKRNANKKKLKKHIDSFFIHNFKHFVVSQRSQQHFIIIL
jgi:hypothetical protein